VILTRTDAPAVHGIDEAIERGSRYKEAGADLIFIEAPVSVEAPILTAKEMQDI